jgi:hypothetical protein
VLHIFHKAGPVPLLLCRRSYSRACLMGVCATRRIAARLAEPDPDRSIASPDYLTDPTTICGVKRQLKLVGNDRRTFYDDHCPVLRKIMYATF